jgi:hypothetical protein
MLQNFPPSGCKFISELLKSNLYDATNILFYKSITIADIDGLFLIEHVQNLFRKIYLVIVILVRVFRTI